MEKSEIMILEAFKSPFKRNSIDAIFPFKSHFYSDCKFIFSNVSINFIEEPTEIILWFYLIFQNDGQYIHHFGQLLSEYVFPALELKPYDENPMLNQ